LNLIHEDLVRALGLTTQPCHPIYVTIANCSKLIHANRVVTLKFTLGGVEHHETFLVAPLGSNQMILGMPWLERVNPNIDLKKRTLTYRDPTVPSIPGTIIKPMAAAPPPCPPTPPCPPSNPAPPNTVPAPRSPTVSDEPEPCNPSPTQTKPRPRVKPVPCNSAPFRRSSPRKSRYPIPISMTTCIEKGDIVFLAFVKEIPEAELNSSHQEKTPRFLNVTKTLPKYFRKRNPPSCPRTEATSTITSDWRMVPSLFTARYTISRNLNSKSSSPI